MPMSSPETKECRMSCCARTPSHRCLASATEVVAAHRPPRHTHPVFIKLRGKRFYNWVVYPTPVPRRAVLPHAVTDDRVYNYMYLCAVYGVHFAVSESSTCSRLKQKQPSFVGYGRVIGLAGPLVFFCR